MKSLFTFFSSNSTKAGISATAFYWFFENHQALIGALVSLAVAVSSVAYQYYRIIEMKNDERRKEELHQKNLKKLD
jgi:AcrR family transcriptional regulator